MIVDWPQSFLFFISYILHVLLCDFFSSASVIQVCVAEQGSEVKNF